MLQELLNYTRTADQILVDLLTANEAPEKAVQLFSHVLNAQHVWARRITGEKIEYTTAQLHPVEAFAEISRINFEAFQYILKHVPLDRVIDYSTFQGDRFSNTVQDILFHVVNHSTYHRAQIATECRRNGIEPAVTDYILLKRKGEI